MGRPRIESIVKPPTSLNDYPDLQKIAVALFLDYQMGSGGSHPQVIARWSKLYRLTVIQMARTIIYAKRDLNEGENAIIAWVGSRGYTQD